MAKFESVEGRVYPTLALTLSAGDVVDLPDDTSVAGLVVVQETNKKAAPVVVETPVADAAPIEKVGE